MSKDEQIKRLKENLCEQQFLHPSDVKLIVAAGLENLVSLAPGGGWHSPKGIWPDKIYRIHRNYTPAPDVPVFDGYELCEVTEDGDGLIKFKCLEEDKLPLDGDGDLMPIDMAPRFGCCGYVFKEAPKTMHCVSAIFVDGEGNFNWIAHGDYKPATLGWVAFRSEQK
jgi:hypothetical protein